MSYRIKETNQRVAQTTTSSSSLLSQQRKMFSQNIDHKSFSQTRSLDDIKSGQGHDFNRISILPTKSAISKSSSQPVVQTCPMGLASPRACPFGGICHTCPIRVHTKLKVDRQDDEYEREADRVAEQVVSMPTPNYTKNKKDSNHFHFHDSVALPNNKFLSFSLRSYYDPRFNYDFSKVRLHLDSNAAKSAKLFNARAFTIGNDIYFGEGQYSPQTAEGKKLLTHELAHVVQQNKQVGFVDEIINGAKVPNKSNLLHDCPHSIQFKVDDKGFFDYFNSCMKSLGLPVPSSLFETVSAAAATLYAIAEAVETFGTAVTIGELIGAGTLSEGLLVVGALTASFYLGACIGCMSTALGETISGGYSLGDVLYDVLGPKPGLWLAETLGL